MSGNGFIVAVGIVLLAFVAVVVSRFLTREAVIRRRLHRTRLRSIAQFPDGGDGRVVGRLCYIGDPITAPLSHRRCALYHVVVEAKRSSGNGSHWRTVIDTTLGADWVLADGTGHAVVRMSPMETVVFKDAHYRSGAFDDATPALETFLAAHSESSTSFFGFNRALRYKEGILEHGEEVTVSGQARWMDIPVHELHPEQPNAAGTVRALVFAGTRERPLLVSDEVDTVQGTYNPLRRLRGSRGACVNCGYDLRGQPSTGCPECGWRR